jgi:hypothetical protein
MLRKKAGGSLETFLSKDVFSGKESSTFLPDQKDVDGFMAFMERYMAGLPIERAAVESLG